MKIAIIIFITAILLIIVVHILKNVRKHVDKGKTPNNLQTREFSLSEYSTKNEIAISFDMLPTETVVDDNKLVEITDKKIIARVVDTVPKMAQAGVSVGNVVKNNAQVLYQAIIPKGAKLVDSKNMAGALRGFYRGANGIKGHADFVKVKNSANTLANATSSAMNVASMVVGQYYMSQINGQLEDITQKISRITDFQDNEFMSKVFALVTQIKIMSEFQTEIVDNYELRNSELIKLDNLEHECAELLGQSNKTIVDLSSKKSETYEEYQNICISLQKWVLYQRTLLELLCKIAELKFVMRLGTLSIQQCSSLLNTYVTQAEQASDKLLSWHQKELKTYDIHLDLSNRKREGFDGIIHKIPSLFNEEYGYRPISEKIVTVIEEQIKAIDKPTIMENDKLYEKDVRMIVKDGKLYYLPESN